jgi:hypothetical protein
VDDFPSSSQRHPSKEEFPSNAHQAKDAKKEEPKKVEKVIQGEARTRKRPMHKRIVETFVGGNPKNVSEFVLFEVLIPAARDLVVDTFQSGIERTFYGEVRSTRRPRGMGAPGGYSVGHVDYRSRSGSGLAGSRQDPRDRPSAQRRAKAHDFREIILPTRAEADEVIDRLFALISQYEVATVADLYDLCGFTSSFTDVNFGWTDIRGAGATRIRNGEYLLNLPQPESLK